MPYFYIPTPESLRLLLLFCPQLPQLPPCHKCRQDHARVQLGGRVEGVLVDLDLVRVPVGSLTNPLSLADDNGVERRHGRPFHLHVRVSHSCVSIGFVRQPPLGPPL